MPSSTRATNSSHSAPARPKSSEARQVPTSEARITGRRPTWSESRPQSGAKTNWHSA